MDIGVLAVDEAHVRCPQALRHRFVQREVGLARNVTEKETLHNFVAKSDLNYSNHRNLLKIKKSFKISLH